MPRRSEPLSGKLAARLAAMVLVLVAFGTFWPNASEELRTMCYVVAAAIVVFGAVRIWSGGIGDGRVRKQP